MAYSVITLAIAITSGILLLVFRKQIASFQKAKADKGKGLVNARLRELPESHFESVAIFGSLICFAGAVLTLIELLNQIPF